MEVNDRHIAHQLKNFASQPPQVRNRFHRQKDVWAGVHGTTHQLKKSSVLAPAFLPPPGGIPRGAAVAADWTKASTQAATVDAMLRQVTELD
jgi:hypothetical protein